MRPRRGRFVGAFVAVVLICAVALFFRPSSEDDNTAASRRLSPATAQPDTAVLTASYVTGDLLQVSEYLRWPGAGPPELLLELSSLSDVGGVGEAYAITVADLNVTQNGLSLQVKPVESSTSQWVVQTASVATSAAVTIEYTLHGAIRRSSPSTEGRALGVLTPLSGSMLLSTQLLVQVTGDEAISLACPEAADLRGMLCGRQRSGQLTANLPPGDPRVVLVQLNLLTV